jgi:hypothetical protein
MVVGAYLKPLGLSSICSFFWFQKRRKAIESHLCAHASGPMYTAFTRKEVFLVASSMIGRQVRMHGFMGKGSLEGIMNLQLVVDEMRYFTW